MSDLRVIEINGVKLEVDLPQAKQIENFKVGDTVKLLVKEYGGYSSKLGVIVGFDNFVSHPTIIVAYLLIDYSKTEIKFAYINSESKDYELCQLNNWDLPYTKTDMLMKFDTEIAKKEEELREIKAKKEIFQKMFGKYFEHQLEECCK